MTDPTVRQLQVVQAVVDAGGAKLAAPALGITTESVRRTVAQARIRVGVETTAQLHVELACRGLVRPARRIEP